MARSHLSLRCVSTALGPISSHRKWRQFHRSQPPKDGEVYYSLRWVPTVLAPLSSPRNWRQFQKSQCSRSSSSRSSSSSSRSGSIGTRRR
eukprot:6952592-Pyramimonas_sp.AAC.1